MGPFGPAQGIPKAERGKEKARAFFVSVGILFAGVTLAKLTKVPAFTPVAFLAVGVLLAKRAQVDLRPALFFALIAFYLAGSLTTSARTAKPARASFKQANTANLAMSTGLASAPVEGIKALVAQILGSDEAKAARR
jgi:hypothetical protein